MAGEHSLVRLVAMGFDIALNRLQPAGGDIAFGVGMLCHQNAIYGQDQLTIGMG